MKDDQLVPVEDFCQHYQVEIKFIDSLKDYELIEVTTIDEKSFIHADHLRHIEKLMRLYYDLDVNFEGIDIIHHLLQRIEDMQQQMLLLQNKSGEI